jgi:hypothetical protein
VKRTTFKTILFLTILLVALTSLNSFLNIQGEKVALKPTIGKSPKIDGKIDTNINEWDDALKTSMTLYQNTSEPINGLPVDFWMVQDKKNLYIAIQVKFEDHSSSEYAEEFVGILITNSNPGDPPEFKDAKILQFSNISTGDFNYGDYYINDSTYHVDVKSNGTGAAALTGDTSVYEFSLPVEVFDPSYQDVYLRSGYNYTFGVVYGKTPSYPGGIILSNYKLVQIQFPKYEKPPIDWNLVLFVLTFIIFGVIGIIYAIYIYRITKLKDKIRRLRS